MTVLLRAAEIVKRPVVTLAGRDIAQVKDVVYASDRGELSGFTLNGRGLFAGPMRKTLPWANVHGLGPDAVIVRDESALAGKDGLAGDRAGSGEVLGARVLTDGGRFLGTVTDLILAVGTGPTDAVGYEIQPADDAAPRRQFVPLPDTIAVSGEALVVPESATEFIRDDLAGFGAAVDEFRERLRAGAPRGSTVTGTPSDADVPAAGDGDDPPAGGRHVAPPVPPPTLQGVEPVAPSAADDPALTVEPPPRDPGPPQDGR